MAVLIVELQWLQLDGNSHVIYAEEEAGGTRLQIDGKTCLLQVNTPFFIFLVSDWATSARLSVSFIIAFHSTTLSLKTGFVVFFCRIHHIRKL